MRRRAALARRRARARSAGCADRGLASGPASTPAPAPGRRSRSPPIAAGAVLAALIVLPALRPGRIRARQLGARRSRPAAWRWPARSSSAPPCAASSCSTEPPDAEQAASLLRLTGARRARLRVLQPHRAGDGGRRRPAHRRCSCSPLGSRPTPTRSSGALAAGLLGVEVIGSVACWVLRRARLPPPRVRAPRRWRSRSSVVATVAVWPRGAVAEPTGAAHG